MISKQQFAQLLQALNAVGKFPEPELAALIAQRFNEGLLDDESLASLLEIPEEAVTNPGLLSQGEDLSEVEAQIAEQEARDARLAETPAPKKKGKKKKKPASDVTPAEERKIAERESKALDKEAKQFIKDSGETVPRASGKSIAASSSTVEAGGEQFDRVAAQADPSARPPDEILMEAESVVDRTAIELDAADEIQRKLVPHLGADEAAKISTLDDMEKALQKAAASAKSGTKPQARLTAALTYLRNNRGKFGTPGMVGTEDFATALVGQAFGTEPGPESRIFGQVVKDAFPKADPSMVQGLKETAGEAVTPTPPPQPPGKRRAPQGQPGVVGNVKPNEQFKIPANLEEALAAEELESERWRQRTQGVAASTNPPPNARGQAEDVRGLGRGARKPLQFPLAKAGAVEAAAVTPKAPPPPKVEPPAPKTPLGSLMDMVKGLVSSEVGAGKEVIDTFAKKGLIAGGGALGKWGLMTGAGGLLTSMLMSGATNKFNELRRLDAAEVPSVESILNRARLQEMQVEQARNTLNSNPELMNKLLRQVSEQQISRKGMLPGEIQIGGALGEGPFSDPEGLVTRLAIGLPPG